MRIYYLSVLLSLFLFPFGGWAQRSNEVRMLGYTVESGDTTFHVQLQEVRCYGFKRKKDRKLYERLVRAVKLTYPIALDAERRLRAMEQHIATLKTKREQDKYIKKVEEELKEEYTPILKKMSMYQGMVLLKLIDRQTGKTSYSLVQELRGKFSAVFWQGVTRLFGGNLKAEYDALGDDAAIEYIISLYERGLI